MSADETEQLLNTKNEQQTEKKGLTSGSKLKETMIILAMLSINMLGLCVDSMPITFFNYEAKERGLLEYQTGMVMGCYDFGRLVFGLLCPMLIRKITAKKSMMLGAAVCGISSILFGFVAYLKQPWLLFALFALLRTISGSGAILLNVSCTALLMQSKHYTNATLFSWIELAIGMGFTLGGLIGGALIQWVGFTFSFIVIGGIVCVSAIPCIFCVPNITDVNAGEKSNGLSDFIKLPGVLILLLLFISTNYGTSGLFNMIGDWVVTTFDVPISTWSLYFCVAPVMFMIGNLVASVITNRGYVYSAVLITSPVYVLCFFFMCPSPILDPLFNNKHYLPLTVSMFGVVTYIQPHIIVPVYQALVNLALANGHGEASLNTYAIVSSSVNFAWAIGSMSGPPLIGITTQLVGFPWATTSMGFIYLTSFTALTIFLITMRMLGKPMTLKSNSCSKREKVDHHLSSK